MTKYALTSISPKHVMSHVQPMATKSWADAGFKVLSFNCPNEISVLKEAFPDVQFIPCYRTMEGVFKAPYVPISAFIDYAKEHDLGQVMLINSDIVLRDEANEFDKYWDWAVNGLVIARRENHDGTFVNRSKELYGIDVFVINCLYYHLIPQSMFCMGQTWWDYWIPYRFIKSNNNVFEVKEALFFHQTHKLQYNREEWIRMTEYFKWIENISDIKPNRNGNIYYQVDRESQKTANQIDAMIKNNTKNSLQDTIQHSTSIIKGTLNVSEIKKFLKKESITIIEVGANSGQTTVSFVKNFPNATIHCFEPDPRAISKFKKNVKSQKVTLYECAIGNKVGSITFHQSSGLENNPSYKDGWDESGSIRPPKNHLTIHPWVKFNETIEVPITKLDVWGKENGINEVDFIWADVQGAEEDLIKGGIELINKAKFIYTEYSNEEQYDGQINLEGICNLLPSFRVLKRFENDVLLINLNKN